MADVTDLSNPDVLSHIPVFATLTVILIGALGFLGKKAWGAYSSFKAWVVDTVDERVPEKLNEKLYTKLPVILRAQIPEIMNEVLAAKFEAHEATENAKMIEAFSKIKDEITSSRNEQDQELRNTTEEILKKLTNVDSHLSLIQARLEGHDARLRILESHALSVVESSPRRRRRKGGR